MSFKKAVKYDAKIRMALAGPAGSGKTYTALKLATRFGGKIAVVDTEHGSASKYADLFDFDVMEMLPPYHPDRFVEAIKDAEAGGYSTVVIDSISHAWTGTGGLLDEVDNIAKRKAGSFNAWKDATPIQNRLVDTIIACGVHVIVTMRAKQEYVVEDKNGRATPRKVGMAPVQREGVEYEFDVYGMLDDDNTLLISKTRCPALTNGVYKKPGDELADVILAWLKGEKPADAPAQEQPKPTEQPKEAPKATNARPYAPEVVKAKLLAAEAKANDKSAADPARRGAVAGNLQEAGGNEQARHLFLDYVFGIKSSKDLTNGQAVAIGKWLSFKDAEGSWQLLPEAVEEMKLIVRAQQKALGQQDMFEEAA